MSLEQETERPEQVLSALEDRNTSSFWNPRILYMVAVV